MILPFMTHFPSGEPTYFIHKIWKGIAENFPNDEFVDILNDCLEYNEKHLQKFGFNFDSKLGLASKVHTIREDQSDRWKPEMMIDFYVNNRTKNAFQFAPRIPVISTQEIFMTRRGSMLEITIAQPDSYIGGDDFYVNAYAQGILATNDGFDEYDDFRKFFIEAIEKNGKATGNFWFKGKIIHWTDLKY